MNTEKTKTYTGSGTVAVAWTGPCPHSEPTSRVMPDGFAPEWVKGLIRPESTNHDNGISAGISGGEYWVVNGKAFKWPPAWTPKPGEGSVYAGTKCVHGYCCVTIHPGDRVEKVRVEIRPRKTPAFPLPHVGNIPGYGLGVIGPEVTSSERGVPAEFTVEVA